MTKTIAILALLISSIAFSQELSLKGSTVFQQEKKLKNKEVLELLQSNIRALEFYQEARTKTTVGGLLLGLGLGLAAGDVLYGATADVKYPTPLTYVGLAATIISIPVLCGRSKKLKKSIELYNKNLKTVGNNDSYEMRFTANSNGIGFKLSF
ncbi:hypothetical protein [Flavobacterium sp.]|uniref:hypothetical protein n=1 Tax=Flavobacterium sp. TaxID=239 RepID=UPI00260AA7AE|nr:hypothetical protein [Flavobacterium sp.]